MKKKSLKKTKKEKKRESNLQRLLEKKSLHGDPRTPDATGKAEKGSSGKPCNGRKLAKEKTGESNSLEASSAGM